jgi:hypothetical protein
VSAHGEPAFPQTPQCVSWGKGMSLRDYFAAKAIPALLAANAPEDAVAVVAYRIADAMLAARET